MYWIKPSVRNAIRTRDNSTCCYCGKYVPKRQRSLDHVISRYDGGSDTPDNLVLTCISCNSTKGKKTLGEYTQYLVLEGIISYASAVNIHKRVNKRLAKSV
jgi:5-methylcytosine-specific restriction endonuclease McrA